MAEGDGERVLLYIYDLSGGLARSLSPTLIGRQIEGIWHTSVVCFGYEFYYGQGIFVTDRVGQTRYGTPVEIKDMGVTQLPQEIFIEYIDSLRGIYTADRYHLLENNCNTFTNDVCQFLVGKPIPPRISSLPQDFLETPFGQSLRPMIDGAFTGPPQQALQPTVTPSYQHQPSPSALQTQDTVLHPTSPTEFDSLISSSKMAIAFFTSETCGPCKMIEPHYHSLSKSHTNTKFILVDVGKQYTIGKAHQISATPTFKTFLNGQQFAEWKGANKSALDQNLARLIEATRPPLPPSLRGHYSQSPILFARPPPMEKVLPQLPENVFPKPLLQNITTFLQSKDDTHILVPPLSTWAEIQRKLDYDLENAWMVVDLLRAAMADKRVSGWFAVDGLSTLSDIVKRVHARDEKEWQLRVVTVQLISNLFSTPLMTMGSLREFLPEMIELLNAAVLATKSLKLVKTATAALFNISRLSLEESVGPGEDEIISVVVALVESLKTILANGSERKEAELERLLTVCLGGFILLGRDSEGLKEILAGIEASEVVKGVKGSVAEEVTSMIENL